MVAAFEKAKLPLFVAYYIKHMPHIAKVAELLAGGAIGTLTGVTYRLVEPHHLKGAIWRIDAALAGAGHFLDVGSHALDLLDFLLGPLGHVASQAANVASPYAVEDSVALTFRSKAGVVGSMSWNFAGDAHDDTMVLTGTKGEILFPMFNHRPLRLSASSGVREIEVPYPPTVAQPFIQSVVDDLLGRGTCMSTGYSARRTSRLMDYVLSDYYGGRQDAFWSRAASWPGRRPADGAR
jgi:predicted dehydrogenase